MNGIKQLRQGRQGSVLVVVMGLLFIIAGLVITILDVASDHRAIAARQLNMEQATYAAEAGVERGARFMETNLVKIVTSSTGATNGSGSIGSGTYSFSITRSNSSTYCIVATGTVNGVKRVVSLLDVYQPTYAEFALWSATNGAIYFLNGEVFTGHVHANDKLYFDASSGGPVFHSAVSSEAGTVSVQNGTIADIELDQGLTLNSYQGQMADVDFNSAAATSLKNSANSAGLLLSGTTTITFSGSTMKIWNDRSGWTNAAGHSYTPPTEGLIYVQTSASGTSATRPGAIILNGGTLSGRMTIASESDMTVNGNIKYVTDPRTTPSSTDALGLISETDIWVGTSAPNNLEIDAAMMATGASGGSGNPGSFGVTNYNTGSPRGTLTVYGGIVQETRGAVCTFSGSSVSTGYAKNYSYDKRFVGTPPPYYPTLANKVSFAQWTEGH